MTDMRGICLSVLAGAALLLGSGLAQAQPAPQSPPAATKPAAPKLTLTEQEAKAWMGKRVFSSDGKELGEVAGFKRDSDNTVLEMHADIGGVLGIGESRVRVTPAQFVMLEDRVVLNLTEKQAKALPTVKR
jgi:hypothetical protein